MELKTIILNSEVELRDYVAKSSHNITQIIVFEDALDNTIFFYCFTKNGLIYACKEPSAKKFRYYKKIYKQLAKKLNLHIFPNSSQIISARLENIEPKFF